MYLPPSLVLVSVCAVVGAGCVASSRAEPATPRLELGTGTARFAELADGAELPMVHGAQGGWHVWVAVRVVGADVSLASLELEHQPADESAPPEVTRTGIVFDPASADGSRASLGWAVIFPDPACSVGRLHRIHATLTTATGLRLEAEREIVPAGGESPPPDCAPE